MAREPEKLQVPRDHDPDDGRQWRTVRYESHFAKLVHATHTTYDCSVEVPWDEGWFTHPTTEFIPAMASASMGLCLSSYKNMPSNGYRFIQSTMDAFELDDVDISSFYQRNGENPTDFRDSINLVAWALGHRTVRDAQGVARPLVVMVVRGTSATIEWDSNADVADFVVDGNYDVDYHEGFKRSADEALEGLQRYLDRVGIDGSQALLWLVGHSRGAAVANVMGALIDEDTHHLGFSPDRVWVHTFACSLGTRRADAHDAVFDNIFNVDNPEDYIPRIPLRSWGFRRFGRDLYFPSICTAYGAYRRLYGPFLRKFEAMTRVAFPAFHGYGPTNGFQRAAGDISSSLAVMYGPTRFSHGGRLTFAEYFRTFCDTAGSFHLGRAEDATRLVRYGSGPFSHFLAYFMESQIVTSHAPGAHQEEGYLAKCLLCDSLGIELTTMDEVDTHRWCVYGDVDVEVRDGQGQLVASIVDGKVDKSLYDGENFIAMEHLHAEKASRVWVPDEGDYEVLLRAKTAGAYDVTRTRETCEGEVQDQDAYLAVELPAGRWATLAEVLPAAPSHHSAPGGDIAITVECEGGANVDAMGIEGATWGDHGTVHAYRAMGDRFLGWYETDAQGQPVEVSKERSYGFTITGPRHLVARFAPAKGRKHEKKGRKRP